MNTDARKRFEDWFLVFSGYPHDCRTLHAFESMLSCPFDATPDLLLLMCAAFNAGYESGAADEAVECRRMRDDDAFNSSFEREIGEE